MADGKIEQGTANLARKGRGDSGALRATGLARHRARMKMRRSNVALRLQESLLDEAKRVAQAEGVALNQFINVAVAEKLSALRTVEFFRERAKRGDVAKALKILKRLGRGNPPRPGDEI